MPDTGVYVIVVGHNLEAKCDVANALANQRQLFRSFSCRKKKVVKSHKTVQGHQLYIVATPDLNTPSWTHLENDVTKFKTKVFLYVQGNNRINSDDADSVEKLQKRFLERSNLASVLIIQYNVSSADDNVAEKFSQAPGDNQVIFNKTDTFEVKCANARTIMELISASLCKAKPHFEGTMAVDDRKKKVRERPSESPDKEDIEADTSILDSVETRVDVGYHEGVEFSNMQLPDLENIDWISYRRTLEVGRARSNHVRVNIVGNQGAGKTSVVKRLQEIDITCPDEYQLPTEGIEVNQVTTRCTEREGDRHWETKIQGYEKELNLQRMAFALKNAIGCVDEIVTEKEEESDQMAELERGSEEVEDVGQVQKTYEYAEHVDIKQKELYLQMVKRWKDNSKEERMYVSYWDFAGQSTYYSTHQAFMAPSAVYVLGIDLSIGLDEKLADKLQFRTGVLKQYTVEETLKFWISSIKAYTRDEQNGHAPFVIVGTHKDKVTDEEARNKFTHLRKILKNLTQVEFVAIDNTCCVSTDTHLKDLRNKILDLGLGVVDEEIPAQWINLEYMILQKKNTGKCFLTLADILDIDKKTDVPMGDLVKIEAFLEHEHRRGWLMHFCHVDLKDIIILDPTLLAGYFNMLLRERPNYQLPSSGFVEDGRVPEAFIQEAAALAFNAQKSDSVLFVISKILMHLHIMFHYEGDMYFLPCLLPHREDRENLIDINYHEKAPTIRLSFADAFVPPAFFHLLTAALNEEPSLAIYKKNETPRVYHLFTCFCFKRRKTLWLEVYWHQCCILFDLKNYSKDISELESNTMTEVVEIIENKVVHILHVYRQDNVKHLLEVECVKHPMKFVDLHEAREKGEVMCSSSNDIHSVCWNSINHFLPRSHQHTCHDIPRSHQNRPSDKDLGRLARQLSRENATSLASKLELSQGNILADRATNEWECSTDMQRLRVLCNWRDINYEHSLTELLELLTKRKDYDMKLLTDVLERKVEDTKDHGMDCSVLDSLSGNNTDLLLASDCIGASYAFLMIELGLTLKDIEIKREDSARFLQTTIYNLLIKWRQTFLTEATPKILLDTTTFLGMNTAEIVSKFKANLIPEK